MDQTESLVFQRVVGSIASSTSMDMDLGFGEYDAEDSGGVQRERRASEFELSERSGVPELNLDLESVKDVRGALEEEVGEVQRLSLTLRSSPVNADLA